MNWAKNKHSGIILLHSCSGITFQDRLIIVKDFVRISPDSFGQRFTVIRARGIFFADS